MCSHSPGYDGNITIMTQIVRFIRHARLTHRLVPHRGWRYAVRLAWRIVHYFPKPEGAGYWR